MKQLISLLLLTISFTAANAQESKTINLADHKIGYAPKQYNITKVIDDRTDNTTIGMVHVAPQNQLVKVDVANGLAVGLSSLISSKAVQYPNATPVTLHIKELKVSDGKKEKTDVFNFQMTCSFYKDNKELITYNGNSYHSKSPKWEGIIQDLLVSAIEAQMQSFDQWWKENKVMVTAAPSVKVTAVMGNTADDSDQLLFTNSRPLILDDFKGPPDDLNAAIALTNSAISMDIKSQSKDDQAIVTVTITPLFDKSRSWCRQQGRNAYVLSHEQLHFYITAIKACELIKALNVATFTPGNYNQEINQLFKQYVKQGEQQQNFYDKETDHGNIKEKQNEWEIKIKQQLSESTCY